MSKLIHGHTRRSGPRPTAEYRIYAAMKSRCLNPRHCRFADYGGRGIVICPRWLQGDGGLTGFQCFLRDVGERPTSAHSLDRSDNDGPYAPWNVEWALPIKQGRNSRSNRIVDLWGEPVCLVEAVERYGAVHYNTTSMRLHRGWPEHDAVFVPKGGKIGDADRPPNW